MAELVKVSQLSPTGEDWKPSSPDNAVNSRVAGVRRSVAVVSHAALGQFDRQS